MESAGAGTAESGEQMKVCIVTVYDSINSGSYWQAYILGAALEKMGHSVCYYERNKKGASSSLLQNLKVAGGMVKRREFQESIDHLRKTAEFKKDVKAFRTIRGDSPELKEIDCFILGSDTIWNIDFGYFLRNREIFWGTEFPGTVISYAGSVGNTAAERFYKDSWYADAVRKWKAVSVRDSHTQNIFLGLTDKPVRMVCDPTVLLGREDYAGLCKARTDKYVFIYLFDPLTKEQTRNLREFAKRNGCKIICGTTRNVIEDADEYIINSPYQFLRHMLGAAYVVTDTYHGTIFSTNLGRRFAAIDRNKNKVNDFLHSVGLDDRLVGKGADLSAAMSAPVDTARVNGLLEKIRGESLGFLRDNLTKEK